MDADITIIGAGIIGLAIASEIADKGRSVFILEKNRSHGMGISSRNSEVVHAGIYYPPGSLKSTLCIEGGKLLYETCEKHNLPHKKTGKLIMASTSEETLRVEELMENAVRSGVSSISLLGRSQISKLEPHISAEAALYSAGTGIISAHALMDYYLHTALSRNAEIVLGTQVTGISGTNGGYRISTMNTNGDHFDFTTGVVVNAAGLHSDVIANMGGADYCLHYCKGDYFSITGVKKGTVKRLVYPLPEKNNTGLGVHLTLDMNGRMRLGPDATYMEKVEDYRVDETKAALFYEAAVKFLPFLKREEVIPDMSGIRPKLQAPGEKFRDFIIREDMPGFINLVGIESPGLTAAPAIARHVRQIILGKKQP